jgi:tetratricopeptide (TPR) repeat protein
VRLAYGQAQALGGRRDEALTTFDALSRDFPDSPFAHLGRFYASALRGDRAGAAQNMTTEVEAVLGGDAQYSWFIADAYALADDRESAVKWLERAASLGFINYPLLADRDPFLQPLRAEPAFKTLLGDIKHQWEHFTV